MWRVTVRTFTKNNKHQATFDGENFDIKDGTLVLNTYQYFPIGTPPANSDDDRMVITQSVTRIPVHRIITIERI